MKTRFLLTLLALALTPALAIAGDTPEFIRFAKGKVATDGALQISQVTYVSDKTKCKVVLYGVVHIADAAYYAAIQRDLDSYEAVLYEGVGKPAKGTKVPPPSEDMVNLSSMQKGVGEMLGLTFQKQGINYKAKNLIHADMTYEQMQKATGGDMSKAMPGMMNPAMLKQLGPMLKAGLGFAKQMMANNPAMQNQMKMRFAQQMISQLDTAITGKAKQFIVIDRNIIAMKVLDRELAARKSGTLALFYGAAHNEDFHMRLVKRGFRPVKTEWKNAWTIGEGSADGSGAIAKTNTPVKTKSTPKPKTDDQPLELKDGKRYYE